MTQKTPEPADGIEGLGRVHDLTPSTRMDALGSVVRNHPNDRRAIIVVAMALGIDDLLVPWVSSDDINRVFEEDRRAVS